MHLQRAVVYLINTFKALFFFSKLSQGGLLIIAVLFITLLVQF